MRKKVAKRPKARNVAEIRAQLPDEIMTLAHRAQWVGELDLAEALLAVESSLRGPDGTRWPGGDAWLAKTAKSARPFLAKLNRGNRDSSPGRASSEREYLCRSLERDLQAKKAPTIIAVNFLRQLRSKLRFCQETSIPLNGALRGEDIAAVEQALSQAGDAESRVKAALKAIGYKKWRNAFASRDAALRRAPTNSGGES